MPSNVNPIELSDTEKQILEYVRPYTMTSPERVLAVVRAIDFIVNNQVPGDIVECGVWKGGSAMAAALKLIALKDQSRVLHLYDTFEGMNQPTVDDLDVYGRNADSLLNGDDKQLAELVKAEVNLAAVQQNIGKTNYPAHLVNYVKGEVESTLPKQQPEEIALLRLDTDWYESTKLELELLYPKVVPNGIVIIDDYGHWQGAKKAVDEYIASLDDKIHLMRIDYTGVMFQKR
ncbi:TylF/MycF/NovP-related O-methyltransferase [Shewanella waksmanii]|uniref:TylF/MycF/NovP-related O-methyltransferase n=1 Tax=Shewanella waksmanii TaxID=213783 RepID=UPI0004B8EC80|nr:TylF/MycF/NovP-related O-methyltransferase [Shewanella waksmanii]